jgi:Replication initiation factor
VNLSNGHSTKYEIISCGIDWITATTRGKAPSKTFDGIATTIMNRDADAGKKIETSTRFGFVGYQSDSFFHGHRGNERLMIASGARAHPIGLDIIPLATNVSRLDLQVTVLTDRDRPNLARHGYAHLNSHPQTRGRESKRTLIESQPEGDSLLIGSRRSDLYARLYDKGAEAKISAPRTLWRYEVEAKRDKAKAFAAVVSAAPSPETVCASVVASHFSRKGLEPFYSTAGLGQLSLWAVERADRDVLEWFRTTVSKSIRRAATRYGWVAVLDSLELSESVMLVNQEVT